MADHTVVDLLPKDAIQSIDDPTFDSSFEGRSDEAVIVVETGTGARAYPTRILQNHEVVNDTVGGDPVAVTWCPLCASAVVYDRTVDGRTLTLGVSGKLADNDLVLYDRDTNSEWKQSSGVCLAGEFTGETLPVRPAATMTWDTFTEHYPDGVVLQPPEWGTADYATDRFDEYMHSDYVGPGGDSRLRTAIDDWPFDFHPKALTLGLTVGGHARGYPLPIVESAGGVVNERFGDTDIVVVATDAGIFAYEGDGLSFESIADENLFRADGTTWDAATGRSEDGRALARIPSRRLFAFTWRDDHGADAFYGV
ncbi:MAG: DUF3179 domain-containing protein [Haloarculaceae archaeon]